MEKIPKNDKAKSPQSQTEEKILNNDDNNGEEPSQSSNQELTSPKRQLSITSTTGVEQQNASTENTTALQELLQNHDDIGNWTDYAINQEEEATTESFRSQRSAINIQQEGPFYVFISNVSIPTDLPRGSVPNALRNELFEHFGAADDLYDIYAYASPRGCYMLMAKNFEGCIRVLKKESENFRGKSLRVEYVLPTDPPKFQKFTSVQLDAQLQMYKEAHPPAPEPPERPKVVKPNPFGEAKPIDTAKVLEKQLEKKKEEEEKQLANATLDIAAQKAREVRPPSLQSISSSINAQTQPIRLQSKKNVSESERNKRIFDNMGLRSTLDRNANGHNEKPGPVQKLRSDNRPQHDDEVPSPQQQPQSYHQKTFRGSGQAQKSRSDNNRPQREEEMPPQQQPPSYQQKTLRGPGPVQKSRSDNNRREREEEIPFPQQQPLLQQQKSFRGKIYSRGGGGSRLGPNFNNRTRTQRPPHNNQEQGKNYRRGEHPKHRSETILDQKEQQGAQVITAEEATNQSKQELNPQTEVKEIKNEINASTPIGSEESTQPSRQQSTTSTIGEQPNPDVDVEKKNDEKTTINVVESATNKKKGARNKKNNNDGKKASSKQKGNDDKSVSGNRYGILFGNQDNTNN